jgi:hypothetical protein
MAAHYESFSNKRASLCTGNIKCISCFQSQVTKNPQENNALVQATRKPRVAISFGIAQLSFTLSSGLCLYFSANFQFCPSFCINLFLKDGSHYGTKTGYSSAKKGTEYLHFSCLSKSPNA